MSTDLGRKIQSLRLQSKESQEAMAQKLNISRQAISKWENNASAPDVAMLSKIANHYDVEITYFTSGENSNGSSKKQMKSLFILDTSLYRFALGFVSVLALLFFSVFSLVLTLPLFYMNLTRKKYAWAVFYFALVLLGIYILMTILFPGLMPYSLDVRMD
jgi:transcriptional regulator with XRE-family HTH domain